MADKDTKTHSITTGERFINAFNQLSYETIDSLDELYSPGVHFKDPVREIQNLEELKKYMARQYKHVIKCHFEPHSFIHQKRMTTIEWTMILRHKYLNLGKEIRLDGVSIITEAPQSHLITEHKDFFDVSAFVLKSIPGIDFAKQAIAHPRETLLEKPLQPLRARAAMLKETRFGFNRQ